MLRIVLFSFNPQAKSQQLLITLGTSLYYINSFQRSEEDTPSLLMSCHTLKSILVGSKHRSILACSKHTLGHFTDGDPRLRVVEQLA